VADVRNDDAKLVNWGAVVTNVLGLCLGTLAIGAFGGLIYMVIKFPSTQEQILKNQETIEYGVTGLRQRVDRLEQSDNQQNQLIIRGLTR
jgi:hypothetical protein